MILIDTSIWIDYFRTGHPVVESLLVNDVVLGHPFVLGELAMGNLQNRADILADLSRLPQATIASDSEVLALIDRESLFGRGIGYVDVHLLASTLLSPGAQLLTRDKRLHLAATTLSIAASFA